MYAIYETQGGGPAQLDLWGKPEDEFLDMNEAEEILRQLRKEDPAEFERIATLRDGILPSALIQNYQPRKKQWQMNLLQDGVLRTKSKNQPNCNKPENATNK